MCDELLIFHARFMEYGVLSAMVQVQHVYMNFKICQNWVSTIIIIIKLIRFYNTDRYTRT